MCIKYAVNYNIEIETDNAHFLSWKKFCDNLQKSKKIFPGQADMAYIFSQI